MYTYQLIEIILNTANKLKERRKRQGIYISVLPKAEA